MKRTAASFTIAAALTVFCAGHGEAAPAKKGTRAVVEVEYAMSSSGSSKSADGQAQSRGSRKLTLTFEVVAGDLQAKPITLITAPKGKESFAARTEATGKKHEKTLGKMEAAIAKCKGDEDCEMRVAMQFMGSDEGSAMMADNMAVAREASGAEGSARYQLWSAAGPGGKAGAVSGTYAIDHWEKTQVDDPACAKTGNICTTVTEVKGAGALSPEAVARFAAAVGSGAPGAGVVLDTQQKLFTLGLPQPVGVPVAVTENVEDFERGKTSMKKNVVWLEQVQKWEGLGVADLAYTEPLKELRGEITKDVARGYGKTMTVRWRFTVKP